MDSDQPARRECEGLGSMTASNEEVARRTRGPALEFLKESNAVDQVIMTARIHGQEVKIKTDSSSLKEVIA